VKRAFATLIWLLAAIMFLSLPLLVGASDAIVGVDGGCGVIVTPDGLVLTCKHGLGPSNSIDVEHRSRGVLSGDIVHRPTAVDGVVAIRLPYGDYDYIPVSPRFPQKGDCVTAIHFNGEHRAGRLLGSEMVTTDIYAGQSIKLNIASMVAEPGWSGGPLLDDSNGVIGILLASNRRTTAFTPYVETCWVVKNVPPPRAMESPINQAVERIVITVYTTESCEPCWRFKQDLKACPDRFRQWEFRFVDVGIFPAPGIERVPTFVWQGGSRVAYVNSEDLIASLPQSKPLQPIPDDQVPPATHPGETLTPIADSAPQPGPMQPPPERQPAPEKPAARIERRIPVEEITGILGTGLTAWQIATGAAIGIPGVGIPLGIGYLAWKLWRARQREKRTPPAERSVDPRAGPYGPAAIKYEVPPMALYRVPHRKALDAIQHAFHRGMAENALDDRVTSVLEKVHGYFRMAMNAPDQEEK
jgi:hypothetical protein